MNKNSVTAYVSREIERALAAEPSPNYLIISNKTPYGESIKKQYPEYVLLIENKGIELLGTGELIAHPEVREFIKNKNASIVVFKNTKRVEAVIKDLGISLLNPPSYLCEKVENKISQLRWLGPLGAKYLPPHAAKITKNITWKSNEPFIIQWDHGHTGGGTLLISTPDDLRSVIEKFPERMARVSAFIKGPSITVNAIASKDKILMGNISYQITGLPPFTDNKFTTIGNDWSLPKKLLTAEDIKSIEAMVSEIGEKLRADGWKGLFGVDMIKSERNGKIYLIEINARQPASTSFESELQDRERKNGASGLTTFEAHMTALLEQPIEGDLIKIKDGSQVVQRVTKNIQSLFDDAGSKLKSAGYEVVSYQNTSYNSDLLRVQSFKGIMDDHDAFNMEGKSIAETIKRSHINLDI